MGLNNRWWWVEENYVLMAEMCTDEGICVGCMHWEIEMNNFVIVYLTVIQLKII